MSDFSPTQNFKHQTQQILLHAAAKPGVQHMIAVALTGTTRYKLITFLNMF